MAEFAPNSHKPLIITSFSDDSMNPSAYIGTAVDNVAKIRIVRTRYLDDFDTLGFSTPTNSPKWNELQRYGKVSGCYWDHKRLVQFRWEGTFEAILSASASGEQKHFLERMWKLELPSVRDCFWIECPGLDNPSVHDLKPQTDLSPNFAMVICRPYYWDILKVNKDNYSESDHTIHTLEKDHWQSKKVSAFCSFAL